MYDLSLSLSFYIYIYISSSLVHIVFNIYHPRTAGKRDVSDDAHDVISGLAGHFFRANAV